MPVEQGVGQSDYTPEKQTIFRGIIAMHLKICKGIFSRYPEQQPYQYIDMNAGHGDGSPSIFYEEVNNILIPYQALLVDENPQQITHLQNVFAAKTGDITIVQGDHASVVLSHCQSWNKEYLGLCYHDPNGEVSWEALADIAAQSHCSKLDILINMSATAQKRIRLATGDRSKLYEYLNTINKKHWLIRKPYGNWQWTFLIGTNWTKFPEWKKQHIYKLKTDEGQRFLDILSNTAQERFDAVQTRFDLEGM